MKFKMKWVSLLAISAMLVACQAEEDKVEEAGAEKQSEQHESYNHDHDHNHVEEDEVAKKIYAGYFDDVQVEDRTLSDWEGDWQSVYTYLLDGTLDEVFAHKAKNSETMDEAAYKQYYTVGYKTTVDRLVINDRHVTFYEGEIARTGEYEYDGYEILTYEKGNRGVRFIFKLANAVEGVPQYIQFSDHNISPTKAHHYHIYFGDDRKALLEEMENWPTFYPSNMDGHTIAHEMIAH